MSKEPKLAAWQCQRCYGLTEKENLRTVIVYSWDIVSSNHFHTEYKFGYIPKERLWCKECRQALIDGKTLGGINKDC